MNYDLLRQIYDNEWGINPMTFPSLRPVFQALITNNPSLREGLSVCLVIDQQVTGCHFHNDRESITITFLCIRLAVL